MAVRNRGFTLIALLVVSSQAVAPFIYTLF